MNFFKKMYTYFIIYLVTRNFFQGAIQDLPLNNKFLNSFDKMIKSNINASRNAKWLTHIVAYCIENGKVDQMVFNRNKTLRVSRRNKPPRKLKTK